MRGQQARYQALRKKQAARAQLSARAQVQVRARSAVSQARRTDAPSGSREHADAVAEPQKRLLQMSGETRCHRNHGREESARDNFGVALEPRAEHTPVRLGLVRIEMREGKNRLVKPRAGANIGMDGDRIAGAGMTASQQLTAQVGIAVKVGCRKG